MKKSNCSMHLLVALLVNTLLVQSVFIELGEGKSGNMSCYNVL